MDASTKIVMDLAHEAAMFSVGLLSKNYEKLPPVPPQTTTTAFLATLSVSVIDAMPFAEKEKAKQDLIELIKGYEV